MMSIKTELGNYLTDVGSDEQITVFANSAKREITRLIAMDETWKWKNARTTPFLDHPVDISNLGIPIGVTVKTASFVYKALLKTIPDALILADTGGLNSASIYDAIAYEEDEEIKIIPNDSSLKIRVTYVPQVSGIDVDSEYEDLELLDEFRKLYFLTVAINILQYRLDVNVYDDEDSELMQMQQVDLKTLIELKNVELSTLGIGG